MTRQAGLTFLLALAVLESAPAYAFGVAETPEVYGARLSDHELSEQRGGFSWGGLDIRFGAAIQSYVGDELVVRTTISWTDAGAEVQRTAAAALSPTAASDLRAGLLAGGMDLAVNGDKVYIANAGQTAFIQRTDGTIQNIIVNSASNVDLRQQVDAQLDIAHFAPFHESILSARIGSTLTTLSALVAVRGMRN